MEDNEFEDVLVISYTDRGSSILPQSTAERIMKNIRLEVTQKVTHNSNQKSGRLEGTAERQFVGRGGLLLDDLRYLLTPMDCNDPVGLVSQGPHAPLVGVAYALRVKNRLYWLDQNGADAPVPEIERNSVAMYVLPWKHGIFLFRNWTTVELFKGEKSETVGSQMVFIDDGRHVFATPRFVYFRTITFGICRIDHALKEQIVVKSGASDFIVEPSTMSDNDNILLLTSCGQIASFHEGNFSKLSWTKPLGDCSNEACFRDQGRQCQQQNPENWVRSIKKMYYGRYYLVSIQFIGLHKNAIKLLRAPLSNSKSVVVMDNLIAPEHTESPFSNFRLCTPRLGIHPFICSAGSKLYLFSRIQNRLHSLQQLDVEFPVLSLMILHRTQNKATDITFGTAGGRGIICTFAVFFH